MFVVLYKLISSKFELQIFMKNDRDYVFLIFLTAIGTYFILFLKSSTQKQKMYININ